MLKWPWARKSPPRETGLIGGLFVSVAAGELLHNILLLRDGDLSSYPVLVFVDSNKKFLKYPPFQQILSYINGGSI